MSTVDLTTSEDHLTTFIARELRGVRTAWESLDGPPCPTWTWEDLKEVLLSFATTPLEELVIRGGLSGLRKQAQFKPPEMVLGDILKLAGAAQDLTFRRSTSALLGDDEMT